MSEVQPVDRRKFLSGGFALGLTGGVAVGAIARPVGDKLFDPLYNERTARPSYAQGGEDLLIAGIAGFIGLHRPEKDIRLTYMDIGANDPVMGNNTYYFYKFGGCRGVLVEPAVLAAMPSTPSTRRSLRPTKPRPKACISLKR